jgi:hypothetical protein
VFAQEAFAQEVLPGEAFAQEVTGRSVWPVDDTPAAVTGEDIMAAVTAEDIMAAVDITEPVLRRPELQRVLLSGRLVRLSTITLVTSGTGMSG